MAARNQFEPHLAFTDTRFSGEQHAQTQNVHKNAVHAGVLGEVARKIGAQVAGGKAAHRFRRAENGAADGLVLKGGGGEMVEHHVIRRIVGCADFLKDDVLLAGKFVLVEGGIGENVGENVIVKVFTKGYKLGDTVIRPAVVQVAN